uniref:Amiloride-sensitive sodium channel n=1 Tax=Panagrellus redivivus TaxID=6233 RepID=A0A7E4VKJ7_PANRE
MQTSHSCDKEVYYFKGEVSVTAKHRMTTDHDGRKSVGKDDASNERDPSELPLSRNVIFHVLDDESREFASLTTYHGIIRIYNSATWPSLIFWCLVVIVCLLLFMIHSGVLLTIYVSKPVFTDATLMRANFSDSHNAGVTFCLQKMPLYFTENFDKIPHVNDTYREMLLQNSPECTEVLKLIKVDGERIPNFCALFRKTITQFGVCFTGIELPITVRSLFTAVVRVPNSFEDISFAVHAYGMSSINVDAQGIRIPVGFSVSSVIKYSSQTFLDRSPLSMCSDDVLDDHSTTLLDNCQRRCLTSQIITACKCTPHFSGPGRYPYCSVESTRTCVKPARRNAKPCRCPVACRRNVFQVVKTSYAKVRKSANSFSKFSMSFLNKAVYIDVQKPKFRTIDLLSYVAGSMGLFLGMSCITLLEVFIFLFKAVWGSMHVQRHRDYLKSLDVTPIKALVTQEGKPDASGNPAIVRLLADQCNSNIRVTDISRPPIILHVQSQSGFRRFSIQIEKKNDDVEQRIRAYSNISIKCSSSVTQA